MSKEIYNDFFNHYGPRVHHAPIRSNETAKLCKGRVLDIGCGTGALSDFYKLQYTGVDISDVAIKMAKNIRREDANFIACKASELDQHLEAKFDTIVMAEFLEHIQDEDFNFSMIQKFCKPDTRIIISVPNGDRIPDKTHVREFTVPELRKKFKDLGKINFHNWEGFFARILMTIDLGEKNDDLLSLMMTVKNEEKGLEKAILSAINYVDNIVIAVDNNSTDQTLNIARRYADTVKQFDWEDSFAKARNLTQEGIKTKWVVMLDGHEYIESVGDLKNVLDKDLDGLSIKVVLENGFNFYFPRIVRNYIKWENDVHNNPKAKDCAVLPGFIIKHDRENLQSEQSTMMRNVQREIMINKIMGGKLKKDKKDIRARFYLAQHENYQRNFKSALKNYKTYLKYSKNKEERWLVYYEISTIYLTLGKHFKGLWYAMKAGEELPGRWENYYMLARAYAMAGWTVKAVENFTDSMTQNVKAHVYNPIKQDCAETWNLIGMCFFKGKFYRKSQIAFQRAAEIEKDDNKKNLMKLKAERMNKFVDYTPCGNDHMNLND